MKKNIKLIILMILVGIITFFSIKAILNKKTLQNEVTEKKEVNYFILKENNKEGVLDKKGNKIVEAKYDKIIIPNYSYPLFFGYNNETKHVLDDKSEVKFGEQSFFKKEKKFKDVSPICESIEDYATVRPYIKYKINNKYGLMDLNGREVTKAKYDEILPLAEDQNAYLVKNDGKEGLINKFGKEILPPEYKSVYSTNINTMEIKKISSGYGFEREDERGKTFQGYITENGNILLEPKYEGITKLQIDSKDNTYLIVSLDSKKGLFKNQEKIIDINYDEIIYSENFFLSKLKDKYTLYNLNGKILRENVEKATLKEEFAILESANEFLVFNKEGKEILKTKEMPVDLFRYENKDYIIKNEENGQSVCEILNGETKNVIGENKVYKNIQYLFDDIVILKEEDFKAVKLSEKKQTTENYSNITIYLNTKMLIAEYADGRSSLLNSELDEIKNLDVDTIMQIKEEERQGIAAQVNGKFVYINKEGKIKNLAEEIDRKIYPYKDSENNKFGYKNKEGKVVVEAIYDKAELINLYGYAGVEKNGKWGIIDEEGKIVVETKIDPQKIPFFNSEFSPIYLKNYIIPPNTTNDVYDINNMPDFKNEYNPNLENSLEK